MLVTTFTRNAISNRREERKLTKLGYHKHETDLEIHRGSAIGGKIIGAKISVDGRYVYTLLDTTQP